MATRETPSSANSSIPFPIGEQGLLLVNHDAPTEHRQDLAMLLLATAGVCAAGIGATADETIGIIKQQAWSTSYLVAIAQQLVISLDTGEGA